MKKKPKSPNPLVFVGIGFELFALGAAAMYLGPYIDHYFGLRDQGTGILLFILLIGWLVHFIHLAKRYTEAETALEQSADDDQRPPGTL